MSCLSILKDFYQRLWSDPFWPITYFSWVYCHWVGSSVICGKIFSSVVIAVHLASWIFIYDKFLLDFAKDARTDVSVFLNYYMIVSHTLITPFLVSVWMIRGFRRVHSVISSIIAVDEKLSKFGQCPSKISALRKLLLLICFPLVFIGGLAWHDVKILVLFDTPKAGGPWLFHSHYNEIVELYTQCFFACSTSLIGDRYRAVNLALKKIYQRGNYGLINTPQVTIDRIVAIRELRAIHRKLFFAAGNISEAFGFQLLIIAIVSLITVTGDLYNFYLINASPCGSGPSHAKEYLFWCLIHVGPLCFAAFCCNWTCAQEKYTAVLLQEMSVSDENLRMEIATFSHQLIHYDLHFSVCGFYDVDLSFIKTIIGTVATYLVILIQIGTPPDNCRNSSIQA